MAWFAVLGMGMVLGALGGGGGILTVPILVGLFGMSATEASGSSLLVVGLASSVGAVQGLFAKKVDWPAALLIAVPSTIGALAARLFVVPNIPKLVFGIAKDDLLLGTFAAVMVLVGIKMLRPAKEEQVIESGRIKIALVGLLIGVVSGMLGAGGGFLILPALTLLVGLDLAGAIPTSLLVISLQSLGGFTGELGKPIQWGLLGGIVAVAMAGMGLGLLLRKRAPQKTLQTSFAVLVFAVAAWMVVKVIS
ncbi:MAG: sulfite exporter TauE/SafE family protein [Fimbriimonas sp.]